MGTTSYDTAPLCSQFPSHLHSRLYGKPALEQLHPVHNKPARLGFSQLDFIS